MPLLSESICAHSAAQKFFDELYRDIESGTTLVKEGDLGLYTTKVTLFVKHSLDTDAFLVHTYCEMPSPNGPSENVVSASNGLLSRQVQSHTSWKETAGKLLAETLPQTSNLTWIRHGEEVITLSDVANISNIETHIVVEVLMQDLPCCSFSHTCADGKKNFYIWQRKSVVETLRNRRRHLGMIAQPQGKGLPGSGRPNQIEIKYKCENSAIARQHQGDKHLETVVQYLFRHYTHVFLTPLGATASGCMIFRVHSFRWSQKTQVSHESQTLLKVGARDSILEQYDAFVRMHESTPSLNVADSIIEHTLNTFVPDINSCLLAGINLHLDGKLFFV
jgi:hypothetical protein